MSNSQYKAVGEAKQLINGLMANPEKFEQTGSAIQLLKHFHDGYPIENLRPLLLSSDVKVLRSAVWIASELGDFAANFTQEAAGAVHSTERYVRYYALDIIMLGTSRKDFELFHHVAVALEDDDIAVQEKAMFLLSRAGKEQLEGAYKHFAAKANSAHAAGLQMIMQARNLSAAELQDLLKAQSRPLLQYGAVAAEKLYSRFPDVLKSLSAATDDSVGKFAGNMMKLHAAG